jgi:hypothetical protein
MHRQLYDVELANYNKSRALYLTLKISMGLKMGHQRVGKIGSSVMVAKDGGAAENY